MIISSSASISLFCTKITRMSPSNIGSAMSHLSSNMIGMFSITKMLTAINSVLILVKKPLLTRWTEALDIIITMETLSSLNRSLNGNLATHITRPTACNMTQDMNTLLIMIIKKSLMCITLINMRDTNAMKSIIQELSIVATLGILPYFTEMIITNQYHTMSIIRLTMSLITISMISMMLSQSIFMNVLCTELSTIPTLIHTIKCNLTISISMINQSIIMSQFFTNQFISSQFISSQFI